MSSTPPAIPPNKPSISPTKMGFGQSISPTKESAGYQSESTVIGSDVGGRFGGSGVTVPRVDRYKSLEFLPDTRPEQYRKMGVAEKLGDLGLSDDLRYKVSDIFEAAFQAALQSALNESLELIGQHVRYVKEYKK